MFANGKDAFADATAEYPFSLPAYRAALFVPDRSVETTESGQGWTSVELEHGAAGEIRI